MRSARAAPRFRGGATPTPPAARPTEADSAAYRSTSEPPGGGPGVTPTTTAPQLSARRRARSTVVLSAAAQLDPDLLPCRVASDDGCVEIELVGLERRMPIQVVCERLHEVVLDRRREGDGLAQHLALRQGDDDLRFGHRPAVRDPWQRRDRRAPGVGGRSRIGGQRNAGRLFESRACRSRCAAPKAWRSRRRTRAPAAAAAGERRCAGRRAAAARARPATSARTREGRTGAPVRAPLPRPAPETLGGISDCSFHSSAYCFRWSAKTRTARAACRPATERDQRSSRVICSSPPLRARRLHHRASGLRRRSAMRAPRWT